MRMARCMFHLTLIGPDDNPFVFDDIAEMLFGFDFR